MALLSPMGPEHLMGSEPFTTMRRFARPPSYTADISEHQAEEQVGEGWGMQHPHSMSGWGFIYAIHTFDSLLVHTHSPHFTLHIPLNISHSWPAAQVSAVRTFASLLDSVPTWPRLSRPAASSSSSLSASAAAEEPSTPGAKLLLLASDVLGRLKGGGKVQAAAVEAHPVWGEAAVSAAEVVALLKFLLRCACVCVGSCSVEIYSITPGYVRSGSES